MRKVLLVLAVLALMVASMAPALADENNDHHDNDKNHHNNDNNNLSKHDLNVLLNGLDNNNLNDLDDFNNFPFQNNFPFTNQQQDQNVDSGAISQGIVVEGGGDNSNQCVGLQPIANSGNLTNNNGVTQNGGSGDVGISNGDFTISPSNTTTCDQNVNQTANATGY